MLSVGQRCDMLPRKIDVPRGMEAILLRADRRPILKLDPAAASKGIRRALGNERNASKAVLLY